MSGATVGTKTIGAALLAARQAGLDVPAILARHGVAPEVLSDPDARFPHELSLAIWREVDASGPGAFGLRAARAIPDDHFAVVDYVAKASKDLGEGLTLLQRYFGIISTAAEHTLVETDVGRRLERRYVAGAETSIPHLTEFAFACIVLRARKMCGVGFRPLEVRLAHHAPADDREHRELFDCPVYFDSEPSCITFDRTTSALPMLAAQPGLLRVLERHADAVVAALPRGTDDLRARTRAAIVGGLADATFGVSDVAKRLGTSPRTLQRRLSELGTSHAELLDEARCRLAERWLGERTLAIGEIAFMLGFADVPTFHRAFKRWTQKTPGEHRRSVSTPA
jgi:AraC-like DNA-binding protein